jgi:hypothetical protein
MVIVNQLLAVKLRTAKKHPIVAAPQTSSTAAPNAVPNDCPKQRRRAASTAYVKGFARAIHRSSVGIESTGM